MRIRTHVAVTAALLAFAPLSAVPLAAQNAAPGMAEEMKEITTEQYVNKAALGDLFEIQSSEIALSRSGNDDIKAFAEMMVEDHTASSDKLSAAVSEGGSRAQIPTTLDPAHEEKISQLRNADEGEFDALYLEMQEEAHEKALQLHRAYAANGDDEALRNIADEMVPVIEGHHEKVKSLRESEDAS
ncbi:conserved hypothetical protein [Parvibaculum lavamentivorans DS-1]|uniref:DUF4142 domain-containing protein n=1 Tax=Parvibaculum lavamentivorans (strain DS-1 / DSM 13023 / NCIMB 13966) TaxID=402881 RepID=A7HWP1_PARL1|nr:DUF4142 domain-containing protein [Parvibaculum lavamentivorans]ABS64324.1 conserved hypothetical protein [Parvibaculum lavamentivorans DS-1]